MTDEPDDHEPALGWITPSVIWLTRIFSSFGECLYGTREEAQKKAMANDTPFARRRAWKVDTFVAVCFLVELVILGAITGWRGLDCRLSGALLFVIAVRAFSILAIALRFGLFGKLMNPCGVVPRVASHERILILGFFNYFELIICAAAFYASQPNMLGKNAQTDWFDPIYLSAITQLTIGYGDLHPQGWLRFVACIQSAIALVLIVLFIGRFSALLHRIYTISETTTTEDRAETPGAQR